MTRAFATVGRLLRAGAALALLAGFTAGVPWLLTASAGWPLSWIGWPHLAQVPGLAELIGAVTNPWSDQMILAMLASIGWVLWLIFVRHVIIEIIEASADAAAARRGQRRAPVGGRGPIRWVAAVLVGAIIGAVLFDAARAVTGTTGTSAAAAADAAARRPAVTVAAPAPAPAVAVAAPVAHTGPRPAITVHTDAATTMPRLASAAHQDTAVPSWARDAPGGVHPVKAGDNLWDIAADKLGDPHRWREIYTLNRGHVQANGYALTDPDEIHVGWVLALPARKAAPAHHETAPAEPADPAPAETGPAAGGSAAAASPSGPASPAPSTAAPSATVTTPGTAAPTSDASAPGEHTESHDDQQVGVTLPSQGWISLGLAATIAAVAGLLRLHRRRRARLGARIGVGTGPTRPPVPPELALADAAGRRDLTPEADPDGFDEQPRPTVRPIAPVLPAPIGVDASGKEVSLFTLPGPGLALRGPGADAVARAVLGSALATGVYDPAAVRPVVITTPDTLARLLPDGAEPTGLDPHGVTFDGERLLVLADTAAAVTHAEEEMIGRRRLLDTFDADTITDLNARDDHIEHQPPYVLLIEGAHRYTGRVAAVAAHRAALHLHPVVLGDLDGAPTIEVAADGTVPGGGRLATLAASDLAQLLAMIAEAAARPEPGTDIDEPTDIDPANPPPESPEAGEDTPAVDLASAPDLPAASTDSPALARLTVLGAVTLTTDSGPITTGMRSGSYAALALMAARPHGRTLAQLGADLHPDTDPAAAAKRVRTDINTVRRVLRTATGAAKAKFVLYDAATGRYRIDPDTIEVDLWRMLTAIGTANTATDDTAALTALREAADLYAGDFAEGQDRSWVTDYATTHRDQILNVYARIAELLEPDQPDAAVAALETALRHDPVNEELYQRIIRIHGRQHRPDAVRRTLRRLEAQLADLGDAEPSEATRRIADRQLRHTVTSGPRA
ncbi:BTAD domain-containing putative transcriptional regulator [Actinoplanes sp. NBRC 103695]|uniref:BTAD domain-containing putative transcriptional regulator n=1 Tax=Actinoplanes sp. NBRC 103695 TaxID=3032202 RepID=UPI0024A553D5|nr:BTAD domain-containing putative transcriptional regulator [Actinoplanes sp. NBRC 103695]GLZ01891.1 hypothetical protein Acsp02_91420 [Actinoplanes sp. NBRC 103695]